MEKQACLQARLALAKRLFTGNCRLLSKRRSKVTSRFEVMISFRVCGVCSHISHSSTVAFFSQPRDKGAYEETISEIDYSNVSMESQSGSGGCCDCLLGVSCFQAPEDSIGSSSEF